MKLSQRKASRVAVLVLAACAALLALSSVHAKSVRQQNFAELMTHSDSIVIGTVSKMSDGIQQGIPYTEVSLDVAQSVKGRHGETYTFRQFGLMKPRATDDGRVNLMVTPAGWPTYTVGEQVMLFLHKPASQTGLQTTAGLTQGKFAIRGGQVLNGHQNVELFEGVRISATLSNTQQDLVNQAGGAYQAEAFFALVRRAVEENWIDTGVLSNED